MKKLKFKWISPSLSSSFFAKSTHTFLYIYMYIKIKGSEIKNVFDFISRKMSNAEMHPLSFPRYQSYFQQKGLCSAKNIVCFHTADEVCKSWEKRGGKKNQFSWPCTNFYRMKDESIFGWISRYLLIRRSISKSV